MLCTESNAWYIVSATYVRVDYYRCPMIPFSIYQTEIINNLEPEKRHCLNLGRLMPGKST